MKTKPTLMRDDTKHSLMSVIPIGLALLLHTLHMLLAPALLGVLGTGSMEMAAHHHDMTMPMPMNQADTSHISWITVAFFALNAVGIFYACRVLFRKTNHESRHVWLCKGVSMGSILIGVISGITLL